ncbi:MAG: DUF1638 domain-containing protein [Hyphomicrobiaceae bacterium]|nr:DUF1638 domain-containing protein [Hyphomicrobiaceae bacterium]
MPETKPGIGIVACGALATELRAVLQLRNQVPVALRFLPAKLHNRPQLIADAVREELVDLSRDHGRLFVGYGDCGTGGRLDDVLEEFNATRLEGAHCYAFFSGADAFETLAREEIGTFYLTDYLARQFDNLVWRGLGLDRHPELLPDYFGHYTRLVYLAQTDDPRLEAKAKQAAERLGLRYERRATGLEPFAAQVGRWLESAA